MSLCARCAHHERTCCQQTDILVTDGDIRRITAQVGRVDFWEYRPPSYTVTPQPADPNWLPYTLRSDGTRPLLKQQPSGDCTFLTSSGCSLPREVRPLICRLYPYDYTEQRLTGTVPGCPLYLLEPGQTLPQAIGMRLEDAKRWRQQLYSELRDGSVYEHHRSDL